MVVLKRKKIKKLKVIVADVVQNNGTPESRFLESILTQLENLMVEKQEIKTESYG